MNVPDPGSPPLEGLDDVEPEEPSLSCMQLANVLALIALACFGVFHVYKASRAPGATSPRKSSSSTATASNGAPPTKTSPSGGDAPDGRRARSHAICKVTAAKLLEDGDLAAARTGFQQAIDADPTSPEPRFDLAVVEEKSERWQDAIAAYESFLQLDSTSDSAVKAQLKLPRLRKLIELDRTPEGKKTRRYDQAIALARILLERGDLAGAAREGAVAARIDDGRFEAHCVAASALMRQEAWDEALAFLKQAHDRAPEKQKAAIKSSIAHCERQMEGNSKATAAAAALERGDYLKAGVAFEKAWQLLPERDDLGLSASVALALGENFAGAVKVLRKLATSSDPGVVKEAQERLSRLAPLVEGAQPGPARAREAAPPPRQSAAEEYGRERPRPRESFGPCEPCRRKAAECRRNAQEQRANAGRLRSDAAVFGTGGSPPEQARLYEKAAAAYEDAAAKYDACRGRPCEPCRGDPDACR